jgi:glycosyltransferase involved in cell wall biosynthesis
MAYPHLSIITPCFNSERFVAQTLQSVRSQTFGDWEHIVIDDGSTDQSANIIQGAIQSGYQGRLIRQANSGVARARNIGFAEASPSSTYLLFLDADDCLEPSMLERMVRHLDENPAAGFVYCDPILVDAEDRPLDGPRAQYGWGPRFAPSGIGLRRLSDTEREIPFATLFASTTIIPSITLIRRSVYEKTRGYDESFGHLFEDLDLFIQLALHAPVHYLPEPLVRYRLHASQSTANADRLHRQEAKLYEKWRTLQTLTPPQRAMVDDAIRFREGRLIPYRGMIAGFQSLREGHLKTGVQFIGGAVRRYAKSLFARSAAVPQTAL